MRAFFLSTPRSLVEAARIDGASSWTTLWRVLVPFGRPAILTMMVLVFMWTWNEFLLALVLVSSENKRTAPLGLAFFQGAAHLRLHAARGRLGDRRDARRDRLRLPAAALHPGDAHRGGEGLDGAGHLRPRDEAFGDVTAVNDLSLEIADGEFMVLVGPSGCGKTTALRLPGRASRRSRRARSASATATSTDVAPRERDIAMVFQDYALYPQMSVRKNLAFGLKMRKLPKPRDRRAASTEAAALLEHRASCSSASRASSPAASASASRSAARSCATRRSSSWTSRSRTSTRSCARRPAPRSARLQQRGRRSTTVYVTHDQVEAMTMGDRIAIMRDGVIEQCGDPGRRSTSGPRTRSSPASSAARR